MTTYFRAQFVLPENESAKRVAFDLRRDDGAVAYLNGEEIRRDNLADGELNSSTAAVRKTSGSEENAYFPGPFSATRLRSGVNTLAIAVHQYDSASSDLIFDVELIVNDDGRDTPLKAVGQEELREALGPLWREVPESIRGPIQ